MTSFVSTNDQEFLRMSAGDVLVYLCTQQRMVTRYFVLK